MILLIVPTHPATGFDSIGLIFLGLKVWGLQIKDFNTFGVMILTCSAINHKNPSYGNNALTIQAAEQTAMEKPRLKF